MSAYEMKKNLRRAPGAPKCYTELDDELQHPLNDDKKDKLIRDGTRQSLFEHKNWSIREKIKLMVFFAYYISLQDWNSERKSIHLYKHASSFMKKARTPQQCKNIHSLLKRKFLTLQDVVQAMRVELEGEENYDKFLTKYQKDIELYQLEHKLKDQTYQDRYESLRSKRVTELDDNKCKVAPQFSVKQYERPCIYQTNYAQVGGTVDVNNDNNMSKVDLPPEFQQQQQKLIKQCNFFFEQWLKLALIYQRRQAATKTQ